MELLYFYFFFLLQGIKKLNLHFGDQTSLWNFELLRQIHLKLPATSAIIITRTSHSDTYELHLKGLLEMLWIVNNDLQIHDLSPPLDEQNLNFTFLFLNQTDTCSILVTKGSEILIWF